MPSTLKPEDALTINCVKAFHFQYRDRIIIHVANERKTKKSQDRNGNYYSVEGNILKQKGVRKGVSDFFIPEPVGNYHGLWIELKATTLSVKDGKVVAKKKGTLSDEQKEWLQLMKERNYATAVAYSLDEFMSICKEYFNGKPNH